MIVTIHQPTYLPYLGLFYKISQSDTFVVYDTAQYEKGGVHNRQQIRTANGSTWLTIPLKSSLTPFNETPISYENTKHPWYEKHWRAIELSYKKTPFFEMHREALASLYHEGHPETLGSFNLKLIRYLLSAFNMPQKVVLFSELGIDPTFSPSEKLAAATAALGGAVYLSGPSGKRYLEFAPFKARDIEVRYSEFHHPEYPQYHKKFDNEFAPNMGAIDALFNIGGLPFSTHVERAEPLQSRA